MQKMQKNGPNKFLIRSSQVVDKQNLDFIETKNKVRLHLIENRLNDIKNTRTRSEIVENEAEKAAKENSKQEFNNLHKRFFNVDAAFDNCVSIIEKYLYFYSEVDKLKDVYQRKHDDTNEKKNIEDGSVQITSERNENERLEEPDTQTSKLYALLEENKAIHKEHFLFEYDDEVDIFTSSEEELIIKKQVKDTLAELTTSDSDVSDDKISASNNTDDDDNNNNNNYNNNIDTLDMGIDGDTINDYTKKRKKLCETSERSETTVLTALLAEQETKQFKKTESKGISKPLGRCRKKKVKKKKTNCVYDDVKIDLLERYPPYLRDLIHIVKEAKKLQTLVIYANVFKTYCSRVPVHEINEKFEKAFLRFQFEENKERAVKKLKRMQYRIWRRILLNHIYENHELFVDKVLNVKEEHQPNSPFISYNTVAENDLHKIISKISKKCKKCFSDNNKISGSDRGIANCKSCIDNTKQLICTVIHKKLIGHAISNGTVKEPTRKEKNLFLLTDILLNKKDKRPINVDYRIQYHKNTYVYIASKESIFSDVIHENYLKKHFINFIDIIRQKGHGYKLLSVIFDKKKNKNYMDYRKLKKNVSLIAKKRREMNPSEVAYEGKILVLDTLYELLKGVLSPEEYDDVTFWGGIYSSFYYCLQKKLSNTSRAKLVHEVIEKGKLEEIVKESDVVIDCFDDIKDFASGTSKNLKKIVEEAVLASMVSSPVSRNSSSCNMPGEKGSCNKNTTEMNFANSKDVSIDQSCQSFLNVKRIGDIFETYVNGIWNKPVKKYKYIRKIGKEKEAQTGKGQMHRSQKDTKRNSCNKKKRMITSYLRKLDKECAIVEVSDSSDDELYMNNAKMTKMFRFFNKTVASNKDPISMASEDVPLTYTSCNFKSKAPNKNSFINQKICVDKKQWKMIDLKRNSVIHPLFNSKPIGFKIELCGFFNRQLDMYCINDEEYINVYKNTAEFLSNNMNEQVVRRYKSLQKIKEEFEKHKSRKEQIVANIYNEQDNLLLSKNSNFIKEYFVIIDETMELHENDDGNEDEKKTNTCSVHIYNCSELTTYIVRSKKEKMNCFYENFIKQEVYSNQWKNKIETKFLNYNYIYDSSTVLGKSHISYAIAQIKNMIENLYCENFRQVSNTACLYSQHKALDTCNQQEIVLRKMYRNVQDIVNHVQACVVRDGIGVLQLNRKNKTQGLQDMFYNFLMNYRWNKLSNNYFMKNVKQYKRLLFHYVFYLYPQFINICRIIRLNNFKESLKFVFDTQQEQYSSLKEVLAPRVGAIEMADTNPDSVDPLKEAEKYMPFYNKNGTTIRTVLSLRHLLLMDVNTPILSDLYTSFVQVLESKKHLVDLNNEIHPVCLNTIRYFRNAFKTSSQLRTTDVATILYILNAYLCFLSNHVSACDENNLWTTFLYGDSASQNRAILSNYIKGVSYMPPIFVRQFSSALLHKNGKRFVISVEAKGKVYVRAVLLQLYLTDNKLPSYLLFKHGDYKTVLDSLNLQTEGQFVSFRWK